MSNQSELVFFKETFKLVSIDQRKFEYRLKNHPFDIQEKRVLTGLLALKKGNKENAFNELKCTAFTNPFLEAVRRHVLGMVHLNFGTFRFAHEHLNKSIEIFRGIQEKKFILYPLNSLAMTYGNQNKLVEMSGIIDQINELNPKDPYFFISKINVEALFLSKSGQELKALKIITQKKLEGNVFYGWFKPSFLILEFTIRFKQKRYQECFKILERYKKTPGFTAKANFEFLKSLLDHIVNNKALYVYARDFKDFPELHYQLEVIKGLSCGDHKTAENFWNLLSQHNPRIYQSKFHFSGESVVFQHALKIYNTAKSSIEMDLNKLDLLKENIEKLHYILQSSSRPIEKEILIKLIWKEEMSETSMARLRKLVSRYNQKYPNQIQSRQQSYMLKVS